MMQPRRVDTFVRLANEERKKKASGAGLSLFIGSTTGVVVAPYSLTKPNLFGSSIR